MIIPFREHHLLQLLELYETKPYPLDLMISFYFKDNPALGSKDRREISDFAYALIRFKSLLDFLSNNSSSWKERLSIYKKNFPFESAYIQSLPKEIQASFPKDLFELFEKNYGKEALDLCKICNTRAPTTIRINPLKTTREILLKKWKDTFNITACKFSPYGIIFNEKIHFYSLEEFKMGLFEIQDEASQLISDMIPAQPGHLILDYCAGAGGKTLGFAHKLKGTGQIYLHDIRKGALIDAKKRLKRAGIQNYQIIMPETPYLEKIKKKMDLIVVDAPCSGSGTYRRNPDMKWRFCKDEFQKLLGEQRVIFEKALSFVRQGGTILYATCSLLKEENEEQVEHFLKTYPLELLSPPFKTVPALGEMDGFFAALFRKKSLLC